MPEGLRAAVRACVGGESPWPLFAYGPPGTGKTCAGLCLLDHAGGFYYSAQGLGEEMILASKGHLATPSGRKVSPNALWRELGEAALVVLDELGGRAQLSDHHYDCVKRLLDEREGRPLLLMSNLGLAELAGLYDDRVASRVAAGTLVRCDGEDRRLRR